MQNEASVLSSVSKSTAKNYSTLERSQAESLHFASSADLYEKYFFSIVAEANRTRKVHPAIRLFEFFFIWIQLLLSSYNDFLPYDDINSGYKTFLKVFFFGFIGTADEVIPFIIALSIIDIITLLFFGISVADFHLTHEYRKWVLSMLRIWHGHLFGVFLIPNFLMMMKGFAYLGLHNNGLGYFIVIITTICGCLSIWHYLVILPFFSRTPYLSSSPIHAWNIKKMYKLLLISSIPIGLESFLNGQFDEWIEIIPLFLMICIFVYLIYEQCALPLKGVIFNALLFGCFNGVILGAIFSVVEALSEGVSDLVFYLGPVILAIVSTIAIYFITQWYRQKMVKLLNYASFFNNPNSSSRPTEEMKKSHLVSLKIKSKRKAILLIQIGFEGMSDMFVDWSLCKYCFDCFPNEDDLIVFISWLASLFPSEIQFLHKLITHGTKIIGISVDNRCLFFQIHRIHIFRQSSTSRETSIDFSKVKTITDQTVSAFCKYWLNLAKPNSEFKTSIYQSLAYQKQQAEAAWSEALDKYPNNPRFAKEHALFLLEVNCQFRESIKQFQKAQQLENGLRMQNDKTFHHFVLAYPKYLKSGTVDTKGNLRGPQLERNIKESNSATNSFLSSKRSSSKSSSTNIESGSSDDSSSDQIDMQEGSKFLPQMNLRLALQRAVNGLKAPTISKVMVSALLRAVLTIVFIIICVFLAKPLFKGRTELFDIFYQFDKVQHYWSLMSVQVPWYHHYAINDGNPDFSNFFNELNSIWKPKPGVADDPNISNYKKFLNSMQSQVDFYIPQSETICKLALDTLNELNILNNILYKIDIDSDERLQNLNYVYYQLESDVCACAKTGGNEPDNETIRPYLRKGEISIDYMIRTCVLETRVMMLNPLNDVKYWGLNSTDFCEMFNNQQSVSNMFRTLSLTISKPLYYLFWEQEVSSADNIQQSVENKKRSIKQTMMNIYQRHNKLDSSDFIEEVLNSKYMNSILEDNIKNDLKLFNLLTPDKIRNEESNNTSLNHLEQIKLKKKLMSNYSNGIHPMADEEEDEEEEVKVKQAQKKTEAEKDQVDEICDFIIAFSPFILFFFILPSVIFLADGLSYEMTTFSNALRNVSKADCLKAGERIKPIEYAEQNKGKTNTTDNKKKQSMHLVADTMTNNRSPFWLFDVVSTLVIIIQLIVFAVMAKDTKKSVENYMEYYALFMAQRDYLFKINKDMLYSLLFIESRNQNPELKLGAEGSYTDPSALFAGVFADIEAIRMVTRIIDTGHSETDTQSSITADDKINKIRFSPICSDSITTSIPADYYRCIPLDRVISFYLELIESCIVQLGVSVPYFNLTSQMTPYLTHILDTRIGVGFTQIADRFKVLFDEKIKSFESFLIVIPVITVIFTVLTYVIEMILLVAVSNQFSVFKSLMLRINPISFVANNQLISLVYGKNNRSSQLVSASHAVFTTSPDAMISLNNEGVIEYLNPATTAIFGFTPEQMLGQHVKMILNDESKETAQLFYQMQLMQSGQASLIFESEVKGKRDDGTVIYLKVTLIGFTSSNSGKIADTFGLMCRDMTNEILQKNLVEEAKKQSEQLLLQILPKDIIMRLNRGDTDISFTVQSSTIAFIDIEKFSNYSASLSASEIMQNLGLVFTAYDQLLAKYNLIIKIKLIGDDYMLAAGLFNQDVEPKNHATQVVSFTLECLDAIEDLNEQLNASLQVRIGVNSGGPLIAGVLGTDKPLFDIIGDPINVASRLQSTDIPGFVQISQQTYDYVANNNDFHIEQRGEVELKGKGKQMTYLVHPHQRDHQKISSESSQVSMDLPSSDQSHGDDIPKI